MRVGQKKRYPRLDWGVRKGLPWQWGPSCMGLGLLWWWVGLLCFGPYVGFHRGKQAWQAQVFICRTFFDGSCKLGSFIRALLGHPVGQCVEAWAWLTWLIWRLSTWMSRVYWHGIWNLFHVSWLCKVCFFIQAVWFGEILFAPQGSQSQPVFH